MTRYEPAGSWFVPGTLNTNAPGYDVVLLAHVAAALVGLAAVVLAGASALSLRTALTGSGPVPDSLARYYRPGVNWAGRVLFLVPVFGVALLAMDGGQWSFADTWVSMGMAMWVVVAGAAELALWPAERQLQQIVAARGDGATGGVVPDGSPAAALCLRTGVLGLGLGAVLVAAGVLMVAKP